MHPLRLIAAALSVALAPLLPAETEPAASDQSAAIALFERLMPGLKISKLGVAEPLEGGGTRFVGENVFQFATKKGDTIHAQAGAVSLEPAKSLVTLARTPTIRMKTHSLIATSEETLITYRIDTGKVTASGPHRIAIGGIGKKSP